MPVHGSGSEDLNRQQLHSPSQARCLQPHLTMSLLMPVVILAGVLASSSWGDLSTDCFKANARVTVVWMLMCPLAVGGITCGGRAVIFAHPEAAAGALRAAIRTKPCR